MYFLSLVERKYQRKKRRPFRFFALKVSLPIVTAAFDHVPLIQIKHIKTENGRPFFIFTKNIIFGVDTFIFYKNTL